MLHIKSELRKKYRAIKIPNTKANLLLNAQVLIDSRNLTNIALYCAIKDEPYLLSLIIQNPSISFCLPKITNAGIVFIKYKFGDELLSNSNYPLVLEPESNEVVVPDMMFVPGIAFDVKGYRLGRGRGFYDKYIALYPKILTVGTIFQEKLLEGLPHEPHDCRMQFIITENLILRL